MVFNSINLKTVKIFISWSCTYTYMYRIKFLQNIYPYCVAYSYISLTTSLPSLSLFLSPGYDPLSWGWLVFCWFNSTKQKLYWVPTLCQALRGHQGYGCSWDFWHLRTIWACAPRNRTYGVLARNQMCITACLLTGLAHKHTYRLSLNSISLKSEARIHWLSSPANAV